MKVTICDTDLNSRIQLYSRLNKKYNIDKENVKISCCQPNDIIFDIDDGKFDSDILITEVLFQNMQYNGVDLVKRVNEKNPMCKVIYYVQKIPVNMDIYESRHENCILKGLQEDRLEKCVSNILNQVTSQSDKKMIRVKFDRTVNMLDCSKIHFIRIENRVTKFYTDDGVLYEYKTLSDIQSELPGNFVRCHNATIVNTDYIERYNHSAIMMITGETLKIGRRYIGVLD